MVSCMHTLLSVLLILGLIGALILQPLLVMRVLAALTSRHLPAQRDFARRYCDEDGRL
jgi:hypothetical protein